MRRHLFAIALVAAAAVLGGCGGDDDEPGRTVTVPAGQAVTVAGDEYSFDPETVVVQAGGQAELRVTLRNQGSLAHNLRLFRDGNEVGGTPTFQGGESRSASVTLAPGSYEMVCTVGNHADLGMTGTLEVR